MKKKIKVDVYEREIEKNFGKGKKPKNEKELMEKLVQAAKNYIAKKKPITIRVQSNDLEIMKLKAMKSGMPYQTYINMLIHRDAIGNHGQ